MDEATSAQDEESQSRVMATFMQALPHAAVIPVAYRPTPRRISQPDNILAPHG